MPLAVVDRLGRGLHRILHLPPQTQGELAGLIDRQRVARVVGQLARDRSAGRIGLDLHNCLDGEVVFLHAHGLAIPALNLLLLVVLAHGEVLGQVRLGQCKDVLAIKPHGAANPVLQRTGDIVGVGKFASNQVVRRHAAAHPKRVMMIVKELRIHIVSQHTIRVGRQMPEMPLADGAVERPRDEDFDPAINRRRAVGEAEIERLLIENRHLVRDPAELFVQVIGERLDKRAIGLRTGELVTFPAVIHIDEIARPQVVGKGDVRGIGERPMADARAHVHEHVRQILLLAAVCA